MKQSFAVLLFVGILTNASAQTGLSYGASFGIAGNHSQYSGGSSDASALFHHNDFGKATLGFVARYFFDEHWSVQSGLGASEIGFEYAMAKDYSLLKKDDHFTKNNLGVSVLQVPVTAIYAFDPNCKNNRWFVGLGVSTMNNFTDVNKTEHTASQDKDASGNSLYIDQTVTANKFTVVNGQVMGGIEKTFEHGGILQFGLIANIGFSNVATSTVTYVVENKQYTHTFSNKGDYFGFMLNYYFKPIGKK
jgi:Outer membrane protein beta-barrel domain